MSKEYSKNRKNKRRATYILTGAAVLGFILSLTITNNNDLLEGEKTRLNVTNIQLDDNDTKTESQSFSTPIPTLEPEELVLYMDILDEQDVASGTVAQGTNVNEFIKYNPRTVATIGIPGTTLFFPVVDSKDDKEWLEVNYNGKESKYGTIFLDHTNNKEFLDKVSTIFGHNMKDMRMFAGLNRYINNKEYYKTSMYAYISTEDYIHIYKFAFASRIPADNNEIRKGNYREGEEYNEYLNLLESFSLVKDEEVDIHDSNKLLQLLTCCGKREIRTAVYFSYEGSIPNILSKQETTEENQELINTTTRGKNNYSKLSQNVLGYIINKNMNYVFIDNLIGNKYIWTENELDDEEKDAFMNKYDPINREKYTFIHGYNTFNLNYVYINITEKDNLYLLICKEEYIENDKGEKEAYSPIYVRSGQMSFSYKEKDDYTLELIS